MVKCRVCDGKGSYSPQYDKVIVLLQQLADMDDRTAIQRLIDDAVYGMARKREAHARRLLQKFCDSVIKHHDYSAPTVNNGEGGQ